jgi:hypothetical protein
MYINIINGHVNWFSSLLVNVPNMFAAFTDVAGSLHMATKFVKKIQLDFKLLCPPS